MRKINVPLSGRLIYLINEELILISSLNIKVSLFLVVKLIELLIVHAINGAGIIIISKEGLVLNFSFDAILVMYMNRINIPPIRIRNKIYENQKFWFKFPVINLIITVFISKIIPADRGWFIIINVNDKRILIVNKIEIISRSSLI